MRFGGDSARDNGRLIQCVDPIMSFAARPHVYLAITVAMTTAPVLLVCKCRVRGIVAYEGVGDHSLQGLCIDGFLKDLRELIVFLLEGWEE